MRNPRKPLPNSAEAKRRTQKLKQAEKESAEQKRLLRLLKKKAVKAAKKEADKDGRDEAEEEEEEEEDVDISKVGVLTSATGKNGSKCLIDIHHPCPPNKDKSEYADASPNCFFEVCEPRLVLIVESSLI